MRKAFLPSATQCGLVLALFAAILWGLLTPGGNGQALALAASAAVGTPGTDSTPIPPRPAPQQAPPSGPATPPTTPVPAAPAAGRNPSAATPLAATPTTAARPPLAGTPSVQRSPTATPTRVPRGDVRAAIIREMSPLAFTLNGRDQLATTTMVIEVNDAAPLLSQPGWHLLLTIEQFAVGESTTRVLPQDAVTLNWASVACVAGAECAEFGNEVAYPLAIPADTSVPFYVAAPGSGRGRYLLTLTFEVRVPGNAYAGNYTTNIAVAAVR